MNSRTEARSDPGISVATLRPCKYYYHGLGDDARVRCE
jgi:hypothetical protein